MQPWRLLLFGSFIHKCLVNLILPMNTRMISMFGMRLVFASKFGQELAPGEESCPNICSFILRKWILIIISLHLLSFMVYTNFCNKSLGYLLFLQRYWKWKRGIKVKQKKLVTITPQKFRLILSVSSLIWVPSLHLLHYVTWAQEFISNMVG